MIYRIAAHHLAARRRLPAATRSILIPPTVTSWIANEFVPVESSYEGFDNLAPSRHSDETLCHVQPPSKIQVKTAIINSRRAAEDWSQVSCWDRGAILRDMATILRAHAAELCELEALDTGIPLTQIETNHIDSAISTLAYFASAIEIGLPGRILDTPHAGGHSDSFTYTRREPLGVCLGIGAWNYPLLGMMWKVAPALACGNTMIFKPSECTPLTALKVADLFSDALPQSVLQVLPGSADVAQDLLASDGIDKVSVTGLSQQAKVWPHKHRNVCSESHSNWVGNHHSLCLLMRTWSPSFEWLLTATLLTMVKCVPIVHEFMLKVVAWMKLSSA